MASNTNKHAALRARRKEDPEKYAEFKAKDAERKRKSRQKIREENYQKEKQREAMRSRRNYKRRDERMKRKEAELAEREAVYAKRVPRPGRPRKSANTRSSWLPPSSPIPCESIASLDTPSPINRGTSPPQRDIFDPPSSGRASDDNLSVFQQGHSPKLCEFIASIRLKLGLWCEDLGQSADGWPVILQIYKEKGSENGTTDDFFRRLHSEIKMGEFLLGELGGVWKFPLPKDEAGMTDLWMQVSHLNREIYARIAHLERFIS